MGMMSLAGAAVFTSVAVAIPTTIGILATSVVFVLASLGIGQLLNAIDDLNGYSQSFSDGVKEFFE